MTIPVRSLHGLGIANAAPCDRYRLTILQDSPPIRIPLRTQRTAPCTAPAPSLREYP